MFILDRIERDISIITWEKGTIEIPLELLPEKAKEGDCLQIQISIHQEETNKRKEAIEHKAQRLREE